MLFFAESVYAAHASHIWLTAVRMWFTAARTATLIWEHTSDSLRFLNSHLFIF